MEVQLTTFRIFLVIILIVAIIIIIQASWSLWLSNTVEGDDCGCSNISDSQLQSKRILDIITLLIGIALLIYSVVLLLFTPGVVGSDKRTYADVPQRRFNVQPYDATRERFIRKTV